MRDASDVRNAVGLLRIGQKIEMAVLREGKRKVLSAKVEEPKQTKAGGNKLHPHLNGATLGDISEGSPLHGRVVGVIVLEVEQGSPAWQAGLRKNDVITSANRKPVSSVDQLRIAMSKDKKLLLNIRRGNSALFLYLQ